MPQSTGRREYAFDRPGIYSIRVLGFLDESWSDRFGGMRITTDSRGDQGPVATLVGLLPDQAALSGVLESLYERHLTLMSLEMVGDET